MMITRRIALGLFLSVTFTAVAATLELPFLKVGPVTYTNVVITGANSTDIYFKHANGIGNAKLKYLPPELQKRFGYDPAKATEEERKRAEAEALYGSTVASNISANVLKARAAEAALNAPRMLLADPISDKSLLGKAAPALAVDSWIGDKPELEGKHVVVAFWEPWSGASVRCLSHLGELQKKFPAQLVVVGVSTNSEADLARMDASKPAFAAATDRNGKLSSAAGIKSIPSVLLIDPRGVIRYEGHPAALTENTLKEFFAEKRE